MDDDLSRRILMVAAITGASGVLLGALGAHGLEQLPIFDGKDAEFVAKRVDQFNVGVRYQLLHAVALFALASVQLGTPRLRRLVARFFVIGLILFSGSLYLLVLSNTPALGAITPIGGVAWIVAWSCLFFVGAKSRGK